MYTLYNRALTYIEVILFCSNIHFNAPDRLFDLHPGPNMALPTFGIIWF